VSERKEHGFPGHFIGARKCCFRRHTSVNGYRVSTVGCYHDDYKEPEEIGLGRLYETMVFRLKPNGEPDTWAAESDFAGYQTADEAEAGHEAMVAKWSEVKS
jgi:hypothetical protein